MVDCTRREFLYWTAATAACTGDLVAEFYDALLGNPSSVSGTGQVAATGTLKVTWVPSFAATTRVNQGANDTLLQLGSTGNSFDLDWTGTQATAGIALVNGASSFTYYPRHSAGEELDIMVFWGGTGAPQIVVNGCGRICQSLQAFTPDTAITIANTLGTWSELHVNTEREAFAKVVVGIGDSISAEPYASSGADNGWGRTVGPFLASQGSYLLAEGVSGRRVEGWTSARTEVAVRDSGATHAVVMLGVNNLTSQPVDDAATLESRLAGLYARLKGYGVQVIACTITPIGFSGQVEQTRWDVNDWIMAQPDNVDGVVDTCTPVAGSFYHNVFLPAYNSGDFVHPNAAGEIQIGEAIVRGLVQEATSSAPVARITALGGAPSRIRTARGNRVPPLVGA